jgi:hypothetical protein
MLCRTVNKKEQTFHIGHTEWWGPLHYKALNMTDKLCVTHKDHIQ